MKMTKNMQLLLTITLIAATSAHAQETKLKLKSKDFPAEYTLALQTNIAAGVSAQVKDELFAGAEKFAQGAAEVTEINLDPSTMGMVSRGSGKDAAAASKMNFMVIHSYKYEKPGMYSMDDFQAYSKKLTDGTWNCAIHVRSTNGSTDICSRSGADHETNEMVILTAAPRALTFIHMSGKVSLADLNRMSETSNSITAGAHVHLANPETNFNFNPNPNPNPNPMPNPTPRVWVPPPPPATPVPPATPPH